MATRPTRDTRHPLQHADPAAALREQLRLEQAMPSPMWASKPAVLQDLTPAQVAKNRQILEHEADWDERHGTHTTSHERNPRRRRRGRKVS